MTELRDRHRKDFALGRRAALAFCVTLAGPVVAVAAMGGFRLGLWPFGVAWNSLTLMVALPLMVIGALAALYAVVLAVKAPKMAGWQAVGAVVISAVSLGVIAWLLLIQSNASAPDLSTNPADPPAFPAELIAAGAPAGAPSGEAACAVEAYPSQSAPGAAGYALREAGFTIGSLGVGRAVGTKSGVWFGSQWDAVVRIRPGRSDIRVAARDPAQDRGEACRLAQRIAEGLKP